MKTIIYILMILCCSSTIWCQNCIEDELLLETQAQIDSFPINYPNCTQVLGSIKIKNGFDDLNFNGLSQIQQIDGDLDIRCGVSNGLSGFENLQQVGGTLLISSFNLINLDPLTQLTFIGGGLSINAKELLSIIGLSAVDSIGSTVFLNIPKLPNLVGLNVQYINDRFRINTDGLQNLNGLNNIKVIRGNFELTGGDDSQLLSFDGLENLTSIDGDFIIEGFPLLQNFKGFPSLGFIGGLTVVRTYIKNFDGLQNLPTQTQSIRITSNTDLISFEGLSSIEKVTGGFHITKNEKLNNMSGMPTLKEIRELLLEDNASLIDLKGLESLIRIGDLRFTENENLASLEGLNNLEAVYSGFYISRNQNLTNFQGLDRLDTLNNILSVHHSGLQDLKGLEGVSSIPVFSFWNNENLSSFNGVNNLEKVLYFDIRNNNELEDLQGIENLDVINYMRIVRNDKLHSLNGIDNINPDSIFHVNGFGQASIMIFDNPLLKICNQHPICEALQRVETLDSIRMNSVNCNTRAEIIEQCLMTSIEENVENTYTINPNPVTDMININAPNSGNAILYNLNGQIILDINLTEGSNSINLKTSRKESIYYILKINITRKLSKCRCLCSTTYRFHTLAFSQSSFLEFV